MARRSVGVFDYGPNDLEIHAEAVVKDLVAQSGDLLPGRMRCWDFRMSERLSIASQMCCR
jgi:hypothetical protein